MKIDTTAKTNEWKGASRLAYGMFLLLVAYYVFTANYSDAVMNLGIALIFDPFDQAKTWAERPLYQRLWLLTHLTLLLGGLGCLVFTDILS
jgi:hypothetical protein